MKAFLVTTAQNQAPYFLEWVAHHQEVGFTDIAIYQNDSDDLTHETLSLLRDIGAIQYFYNRAPKPIRRTQAYARAAKLPAYTNSDCAMALDMDEFLVIKAGQGTLIDLQSAVPNADCIQFTRRNFGNSGFEIATPQLVTERFAMAEKTKSTKAGKCLFHPAKFAQPGISPAVGARYWAMRNTNVEIDASMRPFLARVAMRMAALNDASGGRLMDLREAAIFTHMARYYTLLQDAPMRQLRSFCKSHQAAAKPARKPYDKAIT
jgi:hypothetical protein